MLHPIALTETHIHTHSLELLWTSDRLVIGTSTRQHSVLTRGRHPRPRRDSNPQSKQASRRRPTPYTARPVGWPCLVCHTIKELIYQIRHCQCTKSRSALLIFGSLRFSTSLNLQADKFDLHTHSPHKQENLQRNRYVIQY